jgi:hypothetical protein
MEEAMTWLFVWKVVVAAAALVMITNSFIIAVNATRDAVHEWSAPRALSE